MICRRGVDSADGAVRRYAMLLALAAVVIVASPSVVLGQGASAEKSDEKKAAQHFSRGADFFLQEEYAKALEQFQKAYEYRKDPMILFNAAVAHGRLGHYERALETARRARLKGLPEEPDAKNEARMAAWSRIRRARVRTKRIGEAGGAGGGDVPRAGRGRGSSPKTRRFSALGWTGVAVATVGAGLLGYSGYVEESLGSEIEAYRTAAERGNAERYDKKRESIRTRQSRGRIALYSGIGATTVGLGLLFIDLATPGRERRRVRVRADMGSERVGLRFSVPFH